MHSWLELIIHRLCCFTLYTLTQHIQTLLEIYIVNVNLYIGTHLAASRCVSVEE